MDILLVVLRFIHIVAAVAWVGVGVTTTFYVAPAAAAAGESGLRFLKSLLTRTSYAMAFASAGGVTVLAGILLYLTGSMSHFSTIGNIVLGIGAVAGILAGVQGGAVLGRAIRALGDALAQYVPDGEQPIPAESLSVLRQRAQALASHSRVSNILMLVALIGMASARYL